MQLSTKEVTRKIEKEFTFVLNEQEAVWLKCLLGRVGGCNNGELREFIDFAYKNIINELKHSPTASDKEFSTFYTGEIMIK